LDIKLIKRGTRHKPEGKRMYDEGCGMKNKKAEGRRQKAQVKKNIFPFISLLFNKSKINKNKKGW